MWFQTTPHLLIRHELFMTLLALKDRVSRAISMTATDVTTRAETGMTTTATNVTVLATTALDTTSGATTRTVTTGMASMQRTSRCRLNRWLTLVFLNRRRHANQTLQQWKISKHLHFKRRSSGPLPEATQRPYSIPQPAAS